jgi:hypothetical protein
MYSIFIASKKTSQEQYGTSNRNKKKLKSSKTHPE